MNEQSQQTNKLTPTKMWSPWWR